MLFGFTLTTTMVILGGSALLALVIFQILLGKRVIHFTGKLHMKVHRGVAWAMLAFAVLHGLAALALFDIVSF
jgi:hypothetical protein